MISVCFLSPSSIFISCSILIRKRRQINVTLLHLAVRIFAGVSFLSRCYMLLLLLACISVFRLIWWGFRSSCNFISSVLHQFCSFFCSSEPPRELQVWFMNTYIAAIVKEENVLNVAVGAKRTSRNNIELPKEIELWSKIGNYEKAQKWMIKDEWKCV